MSLCLFCIIIFYEFPQTDTNHNGMYMDAVSLRWPCGMMFTLCVNGDEFESLHGQF